MKRRIYAHHAHVFPESFRPDGSVPALKDVMEEAGIAGCTCFAPFYEYFPEGFDSNGWLAKAIGGDDSLFGFGVVDFRAGKIADQVCRIADLGFRGIKVHPAFQKVNIMSPECCQAYEAAQKKNLMVSYHTGIHWHRIADYNMLLYDEVAYRYPGLRMTLEHVGGYCFFKEAVAVMLNNRKSGAPCRVFAGLTSVFDRGVNRYWFLDDRQVSDLLWQLGDDCAIFGLDFPFNNCAEIKRSIECVENMNISEAAKDAILGGNLLREFGVEKSVVKGG